MAVKRLNYFTSQFLVEKDFKDEQDYHVSMRRRLNTSLHTWGVAFGLNVTKASNRTVNIAPGIAIDNTGREIVLTESIPYSLLVSTPNTDVYLYITYHETFDSADRYISGAVDNYIRTSEVPVVTDTATLPPSDGSVVTLAKIHLDSSGNIANDSDVNITVVKKVGSSVAPGAITNTELAGGAVTLDKLADSAKSLMSIDGVSNGGGNVDLVPSNAITITPDTTNKLITIGESHSALTSNPHQTNAAQVGAVALNGGGNVNGSLSISNTGAGNNLTTALSANSIGNSTGNVTGISSTASSSLSTGSATVQGLNLNAQSSGSGYVYGLSSNVSGAGTGLKMGIQNLVSGSGAKYGEYLWVTSGAGSDYNQGLYVYSASTGDGSVYGQSNYITSSGKGSVLGLSINASSTLNTGTALLQGISLSAQSAGTGTTYGINSSVYGAGTGPKYGYYTQVSGAGPKYGNFLQVSSNAGTDSTQGLYISSSSSSDGSVIGQSNTVSSSGNGTVTGISVNTSSSLATSSAIVQGLTVSAQSSGTGETYGLSSTAGGSGTGTKYGVSANVNGTGTKYGGYLYVSSGTGSDQTTGLNVDSVNNGDGYTYGENIYAYSSGKGSLFGINVYAQSNPSSATGSVYGINLSTSSSGSGPLYGLYSYINRNGTNEGYGLAGYAYSSANSANKVVAVYGEVGQYSQGSQLYAGYFKGDVCITGSLKSVNNLGTVVPVNFSSGINVSSGGANITGTSLVWGNLTVLGTLAKSSGSFLIDHPLDPYNKTLRHGFVESPEDLCLYRGKVTLDNSGKATVKMPEYFAALTKEEEATILLTPIGKKSFLTSYEWAKKCTSFSIFGEANSEVSYMVIADRDDPTILKLRMPVEAEKGDGHFEKGELLYPEAYGKKPKTVVNQIPEYSLPKEKMTSKAKTKQVEETNNKTLDEATKQFEEQRKLHEANHQKMLEERKKFADEQKKLDQMHMLNEKQLNAQQKEEMHQQEELMKHAKENIS